MERSAEERAEIERHKYFLSEKQGRDVGWEYAERDWEMRFGESWRNGGREPASSAPVGSNGANSTRFADKQVRVDEHEVERASVPRPAVGRLRRWLDRLFSR